MSGTLFTRRLTAAVVTIAFFAGAAIVVTTSPTPVSASDHDDPTAIALRDGLASFVENLAGVAVPSRAATARRSSHRTSRSWSR